MPKELTEAECRERFLDAVREMARYWADDVQSGTVRERLDGFAHSFLVMLDGCDAGMPPFIVAPCPSPENRDEDDREWWPCSELAAGVDLGGGLHEGYYWRPNGEPRC